MGLNSWLQRGREQYDLWKQQRFLRKHGCETWEQYRYQYDTAINRIATRVRDYYHGYPYVYCYENHDHEIYYWDLGRDGMYVTSQWCKCNLKSDFRFDFLRVIRTGSGWEINEIGGGDYIFFACKNPQDYTLFLLTWS